MNTEELEAKVKELEKKVESLQRLQDIEDIKRLQHAYGYYLMNWLHEELIDCFSKSPETKLEWPQGTFTGPDGPRNFFGNINTKDDPEFMHQMMQISGIVTIEPGGDRAKGRWWGFGAMAIPAGSMETSGGEGVSQGIGCGIYEEEYIREDGVWKILKLKWVPVYNGSIENGWVAPERKAKPKEVSAPINSNGFPESWHPDSGPDPVTWDYPSGRVLPFHFPHPVTGRKTTEEKRNR
ncbi:MAG: nuclear transport factor 2 family protein [Dehalococcoidales bacterium]|nr:nuclear transport factor 2 family protein [Dehalococcoidales bacterium]